MHLKLLKETKNSVGQSNHGEFQKKSSEDLYPNKSTVFVSLGTILTTLISFNLSVNMQCQRKRPLRSLIPSRTSEIILHLQLKNWLLKSYHFLKKCLCKRYLLEWLMFSLDSRVLCLGWMTSHWLTAWQLCSCKCHCEADLIR